MLLLLLLVLLLLLGVLVDSMIGELLLLVFSFLLLVLLLLLGTGWVGFFLLLLSLLHLLSILFLFFALSLQGDFCPLIITDATRLLIVMNLGAGCFSNILRIRTPFGIPGKKFFQRSFAMVRISPYLLIALDMSSLLMPKGRSCKCTSTALSSIYTGILLPWYIRGLLAVLAADAESANSSNATLRAPDN